MRKVYKVLPYILSASLALGGAAFLPLPMSPAAVVELSYAAFLFSFFEILLRCKLTIRSCDILRFRV